MNNRINEFHKKSDLAIAQPLNIILEGENGVGKEYLARYIHERRTWAKEFIIFDWECDHSYQLRILDDLVKNHLIVMMDSGSQKRNTYFFRRIDLLSSQTRLEISELLESAAKRGGLSRSQFHQMSLIASLEKKTANGNEDDDLMLSPFLELFPLRIKIPPLRHRREELGFLIHRILASVNKHLNRKVSGFSFETLYYFLDYYWPNNIDELRSEIERTVTLTKDNDLIKPEVLSERLLRSHKFLRTENLAG
jgi:DNA-binding NtrC family response regulator